MAQRMLTVNVGCLVMMLSAAAASAAPAPERVAQIEQMLPEKPMGIGPQISDRNAWESLGRLAAYQKVIASADVLIGKSVPDQPDELYLRFSKTGERKSWERVADARRTAVYKLAVAECLTNQGKYLPKLQEYIAAICAERTWVMPAHDQKLKNFSGETTEIDLGSSSAGTTFSTVDWLLADQLGAQTRAMIKENLEKRIITPAYQCYMGKSAPWWWLMTDNNWNAVCNAGIIMTALTSVPDRHMRAEMLAAAEENVTKYFLSGFTPDGYCSEGLGYWNFGFGNYIYMSEFVYKNTGGKLDLLDNPAAREPALFGARIQIVNDVSPAFADCKINALPSPEIMWYIKKHLGVNFKGYDQWPAEGTDSNILHDLLLRHEDAKTSESRAAAPYEIRTWFKDAGIYIGRPAQQNDAAPFGVAFKGGNNAENHNHNDVGSFVVVLNGRPVILDPGSETYTAKTFGPKRYESKMLNSFGHDVPVVAGQLQKAGAASVGKIVSREFSESADTIKFDLTSCYPVKNLQSLTRTFTYSRQNGGSLSVTDEVQFSAPETFGTALITLGQYNTLPGGDMNVTDSGQTVHVKIMASEAVDLQPEQIVENAPVKPMRMGINFKNKVTRATIQMLVTPQ